MVYSSKDPQLSRGAFIAISLFILFILGLVVYLVLREHKSKALKAQKDGAPPPSGATMGIVIAILVIVGIALIFGMWSTYKRYQMAGKMMEAGNPAGAAAMFAPEIAGGVSQAFRRW